MKDTESVYGTDNYEEIQEMYWKMTQGWSYIKRRDED
jgi:hypothetical protein